jgi:hypothetical protein
LMQRERSRQSRRVTIAGKPGIQYVVETEAILDRPAKRKIVGRSVPGEAISLRWMGDGVGR